MRLLIFTVFTILLSNCNNKQENWTAPIVSKKCFDEATKNKYDLTDIQLKKIKSICNCASEKMVAKFKTEKDANEKALEAAEMAMECKRELEQTKID